MPNKCSPKKDMEKAMKEALTKGSETIDWTPLDQEEDPEKLLLLSQQYYEWLCRQNRATDTMIRFHQGRARSLHRKNRKQETVLPKFVKEMVDKTYALFLGYEWLLSGFYGRTIDISKLTLAEITQIRQAIEEEIILLPFSLEDETFPVKPPDVTADPQLD